MCAGSVWSTIVRRAQRESFLLFSSTQDAVIAAAADAAAAGAIWGHERDSTGQGEPAAGALPHRPRLLHLRAYCARASDGPVVAARLRQWAVGYAAAAEAPSAAHGSGGGGASVTAADARRREDEHRRRDDAGAGRKKGIIGTGGAVSVEVVCAAVCRPELLVEVEAVAELLPAASSSR